MRLTSDFGDLGDPDTLQAIAENGQFTRQELALLGDFDGFWSSLLKGIKRVATVAYKVGLPILKSAIPGVAPLADGVAKVGAFIVKTPVLKKIVEASGISLAGKTGPQLLEIAASMAEQSHKAKALEKGPEGLQQYSAQAELLDIKAIREGAREGYGPVGASALPPQAYQTSEAAALMQQAAALDPVRIGIVQRMLREGIPAALALRVVGPPTGALPSPQQVQQTATLGYLALQEMGPPSALGFPF
jgi:hypothetical protein